LRTAILEGLPFNKSAPAADWRNLDALSAGDIPGSAFAADVVGKLSLETFVSSSPSGLRAGLPILAKALAILLTGVQSVSEKRCWKDGLSLAALLVNGISSPSLTTVITLTADSLILLSAFLPYTE
jgi:hypothetical protein